MKRCYHPSSWLYVVILAFALSACAVVDQYSGRAIVYNLQAEQAQNQAVLLNIVRASLRRPMQFTTVSTITGTATATANAQYVLPTNVPFRPVTNGASIGTFPALPTWTLGGSMSGGPAFTTPVMDTQEFYQGILKPISGQIYDLYLHSNYPGDLLFNLFVEKVVMRGPECQGPKHLMDCEFKFENHVTSDLEVQLFQALGDYLLSLGLTTAAKATPTVDFKHAHSLNIRYVGAAGQYGDTAQVVGPPGGSAATAGDAPARSYGFCFAPRYEEDATCVEDTLCREKPFDDPKPPRGSLRTLRDTKGSNDIANIMPKEPRCVRPELTRARSQQAQRDAQPQGGVAKVEVLASDDFVTRLQHIAHTFKRDDLYRFHS
jgi:hypothetical protein